jgi:hypothetical protein
LLKCFNPFKLETGFAEISMTRRLVFFSRPSREEIWLWEM